MKTDKLVKCERCSGTGLRIAKLYPNGYTEVSEICHYCNGDGVIVKDEPLI